MKGSITTTQIFQYILIFTFLFAAFLALAITYNKVYKVKNESISIIEKYEGITQNGKTLGIVNNYLKSTGYNERGYCNSDEYGVSDLSFPVYENVQNGEKYYYCLKSTIDEGINEDKIYYNIKLFFKFNLPFLGEILTFSVTGESKGINYYTGKQVLS